MPTINPERLLETLNTLRTFGDFAEDSHATDIVLGCQVLADAAAAILQQV